MRRRSRIKDISKKREFGTAEARNGMGEFGLQSGERWQAAVEEKAESRRTQSGLRLLAFTSVYDDEEGDSAA